MILINKTYEVITPESAEDGDTAESGFVRQNQEVTFRELVSIMRDYQEVSCSPASGSTYEWLTTYGDADMWDGSHRNESLHFSHENKPHVAKYWRRAMVAAGFIKKEGK